MPVVLLHEPGLRADWWRHNLNPLAAAGCRAIAVDLPGHGFAEKPGACAHDLDGYAEFVAGFLRGLDAGRSLIVAAGATARVVARSVAYHDAPVAGALLVAPLGVVSVDSALVRDHILDLTDASRAGVRRKFDRLVTDPDVFTEDWAEEEHKINSSPGAADVLELVANLVLALASDPDATDLAAAAASIPVHLLWGARDAVFPVEQAVRCSAALGTDTHRDGAVRIVTEAGHALQYEQPSGLTDAVLGLVAAAGAAR